MHLDLTDLRLFIHIAESNTLTEASKRAFLSVPTVSGRLKSMESQLGVRLLYRNNQGSELTDAGRQLLGYARRIQREVDELKATFSDGQSLERGHIKVFANTTSVTQLLPDILAKFLINHPKVTIDLQEHLNRDIIRGVIDGSADIGVASGPVDSEGLCVYPYKTDRLVLVTPADHPLAPRTSVTLNEIVRYPLVGLHEGSSLVSFLRSIFDSSGRDVPLRIQLYSFESICQMIDAGVGIGIIPESAAKRYMATTSIRQILIDEPWVVRERNIVIRDPEMLPESAKNLLNAIKPGLFE